VVIAGLSTEVEMVRMPRRQTGLQAAVHPLAARRLFGMPAAELARLSVEGEDVLGAAAPRLRERLAEAADWDERFAIFGAETGLARGFGASAVAGHTGRSTAATTTVPRPEVVEAWRLLTATRGRIRIEELAARVFLGRRRLSTLFAAEFGITPKEAARTMRFTHAVARIGEAVRTGPAVVQRRDAACRSGARLARPRPNRRRVRLCRPGPPRSRVPRLRRHLAVGLDRRGVPKHPSRRPPLPTRVGGMNSTPQSPNVWPAFRARDPAR
jgi:AraC-like DNA-binding protein